MNIKLAMYKGKGQWTNAIIRWWTDSPYSHCELIIDSLSYSSSVIDGGVRCKTILYDNKNWDIIELPWASKAHALRYFESTKDSPYGWLDLFLTQVLRIPSGDNTGDFCSEWVAAALRLPSPQQYSPQSLYEICTWRNK